MKKRMLMWLASLSWSNITDSSGIRKLLCILLYLCIRFLKYVKYIQACSVTKSYLTLCDPMDCSMLGFPVLHYFLEFAQTHVHQVSDAIQPSHPLSCPSPPTFSLSQHQGLFQLVLHIRWPKYWSFSFTISPSNEYSGLISFRISCFDLLAIQQTLKSLPQHHSSKASVLKHSSFFMVQLSHPHMTTRKSVSLTYTDLCQQSDVSAF